MIRIKTMYVGLCYVYNSKYKLILSTKYFRNYKHCFIYSFYDNTSRKTLDV